MAVMIGHDSRIGMTGSFLNERDDDRSRRLRDLEIAKSMKRANAKIGHQHQKG